MKTDVGLQRLSTPAAEEAQQDASGGRDSQSQIQFKRRGRIPDPGGDWNDNAKSATDAAFDGQGGEHVVVPGDTLWAISRRNGISLSSVIAANPQIANPDLIFPGQRVKIPRGGSCPVPKPPGHGDKDKDDKEDGDTPTPPGGGQLGRGCSGQAVRELQLLLTAAGYYSAGIGGNFGPLTEAALRKFQSEHGLEVDGRTDPDTMDKLRTAKPVAPPPSGGGAAAVAWGAGRLGAPYCALDPWRFGDVPWPGGSKVDIHGKVRGPYAAGTQIFDCSGFVVACWRRAGVNLAAHGLTSSRSVCYHSGWLIPVSREQLQPGDLISWPGHIVMYYGNDQIIQSTPSGVNITGASSALSRDGVVYRRVPT